MVISLRSLKREGAIRFSVLLIGMAALFVVAGPVLVSRAVADDAQTCKNASGEVAIAACTRVIENRGTSTKNRAVSYNNRGIAKRTKGDASGGDADIRWRSQSFRP